jgi:hypothetical protein
MVQARSLQEPVPKASVSLVSAGAARHLFTLSEVKGPDSSRIANHARSSRQRI